jgi:hypothetical protein
LNLAQTAIKTLRAGPTSNIEGMNSVYFRKRLSEAIQSFDIRYSSFDILLALDHVFSVIRFLMFQTFTKF